MGIGLRAPHFKDLLIKQPRSIGWVEVHPENYFEGGRAVHLLDRVRRDYQISLHGVGLSLGSAEPVCETHLAHLKRLTDRYQPFLVSEHVSWSRVGGRYLNDLLPLPYTKATLAMLADHVKLAQDKLDRPLLMENPSTYFGFKENEMSEPEFLAELVSLTGCSLLLDVNNIYVQAQNHGFDPYQYLDCIPMDAVQEIHLAGHTKREESVGETVLIDTHNQPVSPEVWDLYAYTIALKGPCRTLLEWDSDLPTFDILLAEVLKADQIMENRFARAA